MIPQDPVMLLSFINLKLRDFYGSLKQLCDDLDVKEQEITDKLAAIDYHYDEERNQFVKYEQYQSHRKRGNQMPDLYRLWQMSRSDPGDAGGDGKAGTSSVNITKSGR